MTQQAHPLDGVLASRTQASALDPLLAGPWPVVEPHDALSTIGTLGYDEADPRTQLCGVPLDLGHHPTWSIRSARLVEQAVLGHHVCASLIDLGTGEPRVAQEWPGT